MYDKAEDGDKDPGKPTPKKLKLERAAISSSQYHQKLFEVECCQFFLKNALELFAKIVP